MYSLYLNPDLVALIDLTDGTEPCRQDPRAWFPVPGRGNRDAQAREYAKAGCAGCHMRSACAGYALAHPEEIGIWGGLDELEREQLRRGAA